MNKESPNRDQAEKLKKEIERSVFEEGEPIEREELPPRSMIHGRNRKWKLKVKYPLIRLLALFFVLLPITVISIYSLIAKDRMDNVRETIIEPSGEFEMIEIENEENRIREEEEEENSEADGSFTDTDADSLSKSEIDNLSRQAAPSLSSADNKDIIYHQVKNGETIYRLAIQYYQSKVGVERIRAANGLASNEIAAGQILVIPLHK